MSVKILIDLLEDEQGAVSVEKTITSDASIKKTESVTINSDAKILGSGEQLIDSDATIKIAGIIETILSDAFIIDQLEKIINSDAKIKAIGIIQTILSDALISIQQLYDVDNKVNTVFQVLKNIANKNNTVIRVLSNISNFINTCKHILSNIENDIRTQKRTLNNVTNDVRFLQEWQIPGDAGIQSLGKTYIRLYIDSVEQTDVDVDSIRIDREKGNSGTTTFVLARAFDSARPNMESEVVIKYNNWIIYRGYIVDITATDDNEKILVSCQDEFWYKNRPKKYFFVGHEPTDNQEKYYETINTAISTEFSWSLDIGNFVPEVINCFSKGESDTLLDLVEQSGNYSFFYDINKNKKLWRAGEGNLVNLNIQELGENINLYHVLNHNFKESINGIINKLRVQMGDRIVRKFNTSGGSRTYMGYNYRNFKEFATPAWNKNYEVLARNSITGEGWDYHSSENANLYKDVYKVYNIPSLNPKLASWTDRYEPYVEIYDLSGWGSIYGYPIGKMKEGFTIDFENRKIIFNDRIFIYKMGNDNRMNVRAAGVKVYLFKKEFWSFTSDPTEDPESETTSPLIFFTDKVGDYPTTIFDDLQLSSLSIQEGGTFLDQEGVEQIIPSWDDTAFARDLAYWQLSKTCDKKIQGTIEVTLDTLCFYNIDLDSRIKLNNLSSQIYNINSISIDLNSFTARISLENYRSYKRTISLQTRGE